MHNFRILEHDCIHTQFEIARKDVTDIYIYEQDQPSFSFSYYFNLPLSVHLKAL
jgi:hypothetical protein